MIVFEAAFLPIVLSVLSPIIYKCDSLTYLSHLKYKWTIAASTNWES